MYCNRRLIYACAGAHVHAIHQAANFFVPASFSKTNAHAACQKLGANCSCSRDSCTYARINCWYTCVYCNLDDNNWPNRCDRLRSNLYSWITANYNWLNVRAGLHCSSYNKHSRRNNCRCAIDDWLSDSMWQRAQVSSLCSAQVSRHLFLFAVCLSCAICLTFLHEMAMKHCDIGRFGAVYCLVLNCWPELESGNMPYKYLVDFV